MKRGCEKKNGKHWGRSMRRRESWTAIRTRNKNNGSLM